jgi:hypothetical protein
MSINVGIVDKGDKIFYITSYNREFISSHSDIATKKCVFNLPRDTIFCTVNGIIRVDLRNNSAEKNIAGRTPTSTSTQPKVRKSKTKKNSKP